MGLKALFPTFTQPFSSKKSTLEFLKLFNAQPYKPTIWETFINVPFWYYG